MSEKHTPIPRRIEWFTSWDAFKLMRRRLGLRGAVKVGLAVDKLKKRGEPFRALPPPADEGERLSRQQAGPAILLQQELIKQMPIEEALALTGDIIVAGTLRFLRHTIGPLDRAELKALGPKEQEAFTRRLGERFFNATIAWDEISDEAVRFTVTDCVFPRLCELAGAPEVAPLLCRGDGVYFAEEIGTVELIRPHTIAEGADTCPFELRWKDPDGDGSD